MLQFKYKLNSSYKYIHTYKYKVTLINKNTIIYAIEVTEDENKKEISKKVKETLIGLFAKNSINNITINEGVMEINTMNKFKRISNESNKAI